MQRDEIPRSEWPTFFSGFLRAHHGHLCSLAFLNEERDPQVRLHPLLLAAVGPDSSSEDPRIRIVLADWDGDRLAHVIATPRRVVFRRFDEGVKETLEIDGDGGTTLMAFQAAD